MHDLAILERHIIHLSGINMLSAVISENLPYTIYFRRTKQLIFYKELKVMFDDGGVVYIHRNTDMGILKTIEDNLDIIASITIRYNDSIISYNKLDIKALCGFKLTNSFELAIEYYNSLVFDLLYGTKNLGLFRINPVYINGSNLLEDLDIGPSKYLTDEDIDIIDVIIRDNAMLHNNISTELKSIRSIANKYKFNLKQFQVSRYTINITIMEDIRAIRFNELLKGKNENEYSEDSDGVY